jgi:hypothetical protein
MNDSHWVGRGLLVEIIASDMLGYQEEIRDIIDSGRADTERTSIAEERAKLKALRRLSRKLGIKEQVDLELKEEV